MRPQVARGSTNRLEVSLQEVIQELHKRGWSQRKIAWELSVNRETVAACVLALMPAISTSGSVGKIEANPAIPIPGSEVKRHTQ